jgi:hypothetical protein
MTISVIQTINNEGANPGTTQQPSGMTTSAAQFVPGSAFLGVTTVACYGGAHTSWSLTDTEGNTYTDEAEAIGTVGNINESQQLSLWFCPSVKGTANPNVLDQKYNGGDCDYQALHGYLLSITNGAASVVGQALHNIQNDLPPGTNNVTVGPFPVTAADVPCTLYAFFTNISELGANYTPTPGTGMTLVDEAWKFFEPANLNNLLVVKLDITAAGSYTATANQPSTVNEYMQAVGIVIKETPPVTTTPPTNTNADIILTAAQVAALVAGTPVTINVGVALTPPAATTTPPPPPPPPSKIVIAQNGATPIWPQNYSWNCVTTYNDTTDGGNGNAACIKVAINGQWGGFLPSNNNNVVTDFSACSYIYVDLKPTVANQTWAVYFEKGGDTPIAGAGALIDGTGTYGPAPVVGKWATYKIPVSVLFIDSVLGNVSKEIYKGAVQDKTGLGTNLFYVDNWYGA